MQHQHAKELEQAKEAGMRQYKAFVLAEMQRFCNELYQSAAFEGQQIKQGKVKTAEQLMEHIKEYLK